METEVDACGTIGKDQIAAFVWFFGALVVGCLMVVVLSRIDRNNYDSKGIYLDNEQYKENRRAIVSIPSERVDSRAQSLITSRD